MPGADHEVDPQTIASERRFGKVRDHQAPGPLDGFIHDVDFTHFDSRVGRWVPLALAALVAVVADNAGARWALGIGLGVALGLGLVVVASERDRWRAQDVLQWYQKERQLRWIREAGGRGPRGDPAAAEIWLGAHQPGTVPQVYRVLCAYYTGDSVVIARELAAMSERGPEERAWKVWVIQTKRWTDTGTADTTELEQLVQKLPQSADRSLFETWMATVEAHRRRARGDRAWISSMSERRPRAERTPLGFRRRVRIWVSRFAVVIAFAVTAVVFSSLGLTLAGRDDLPRAEYQDTTLAGRGDIPSPDSAVGSRVVTHLRALERAISTATRMAGPLDEEGFALAVDEGLPTLIWSTGRIKLATPPDLAGHSIWEVEVLLGDSGDKSASAILTLDRESGPRYLYAIDAAIVRSLREAVGLPIDGP